MLKCSVMIETMQGMQLWLWLSYSMIKSLENVNILYKTHIICVSKMTFSTVNIGKMKHFPL